MNLEEGGDVDAKKKNAPVALYKDKIIKAKKRSILRHVSHLLPQTFLSKTEICKHEYGCFENVVRHAFKNFLIGFFLQMILKNIMLVAKPARLLKNL